MKKIKHSVNEKTIDNISTLFALIIALCIIALVSYHSIK